MKLDDGMILQLCSALHSDNVSEEHLVALHIYMHQVVIMLKILSYKCTETPFLSKSKKIIHLNPVRKLPENPNTSIWL